MRKAVTGDTVMVTYTASLRYIAEGGKYKVLELNRDCEEVWLKLASSDGFISDYYYEAEDSVSDDSYYPKFKVVSGKWWKT